MKPRMIRGRAIESEIGRLCAFCGDTIDTIGEPGKPGTVERRTRTGRRFRRDRAYCSDECRREQRRTWLRDCAPYIAARRRKADEKADKEPIRA